MAVLAVASLAIRPSAQLALKGSVPLIVVAETTVNIQGALIADPDFSEANGGGAVQTTSGAGGGPGGGSSANGSSYIAGAGGGYCGVGGAGANSAPDGGPSAGGKSYGSPTLSPLLPGSSGGGEGAGLEGGEGGGAIQITAGQSILIGAAGVVSTPGRGARGNGGGGGSGGAILLEAPTVTVSGALAANGGGAGAFHGGGNAQDGQPNSQPAQGQDGQCALGAAGTQIDGPAGTSTGANSTSGGGGAVGRIRINTTTGMATVGSSATVSPALSTPCSTQGVLGTP